MHRRYTYLLDQRNLCNLWCRHFLDNDDRARLQVRRHHPYDHRGGDEGPFHTLGNGFQEVIYQRALAIEMGKQGLVFQRELEMPIFYDGQEIGTWRVDFLVEGKVMVELKTLTKVEKVHLAQAINYLEAYQLEVGLCLSFGAKSLEYRRLVKSQERDRASHNPPSNRQQDA